MLRTFIWRITCSNQPTLLILERENWAEKAKLISKYANFIRFFTDTALYSENGYAHHACQDPCRTICTMSEVGVGFSLPVNVVI